MIAIIDYGAGNIRSVEKSLMHIGCEVEVTQDPSVLVKADGAVLPGVGSFGDAMHELRGRELEAPIKAFVASGKPFLGICLGLQILFESSEESPGVSGLSLLKGKVLRIPAAPGLKIPHIGWNSLEIKKKGRRVVPKHYGRAVCVLCALVLFKGRRRCCDRCGAVRCGNSCGGAEK